MIICALCEQPAVAVQILQGGRARPICLLHDVPFSMRESPAIINAGAVNAENEARPLAAE